MDEFVLDSLGNYYRTVDVEYVKYINFFGGFSLRYAGFGVCRVKKEIVKLKELSFDEIKQMAIEFLNFYKKMGAGSAEDFFKIKEK